MNYKKLLFGTSIICGIALTLVALLPDRMQGMLNSNILTSSYGSDTCTTITDPTGAISWTFTPERTCGQFANGEWWIVGPATVTAISPAPQVLPPYQTQGPFDVNGSMINPIAGQTQGFDHVAQLPETGPAKVYSASKNVALQLATGGIALRNNDVLVSSKHGTSFGPRGQNVIDTIAALTVLPSIPAEGSFRPTIYGTDRSIPGNVSQMIANWNLLKDFPAPAGTPTKAYIESEMPALPWFEWVGAWYGGSMQPLRNTVDGSFQGGQPLNGASFYGREISYKFGEVGLWLNTNQPFDDKKQIAIRMIQAGIDIEGYVNNGGAFYHDGGHKSGRKLPVVIAAAMLNDASLKTLASNPEIFQEDTQTFFVTQSDVNRKVQDPVADGFCGPEKTAAEKASQWCERIFLRYTQEDVGKADWGIRHRWQPYEDNAYWGSTYRNVNWSPMNGSALTAELMGLKSLWNHDALFAYAERSAGIQGVGNAFTTAMYAYRGPVTPPTNSTLNVSKTGSGTVTATGINCGTDCSEVYTIANNTQVILTATPATGYQFSSWSGACTGAGACIVTMDANKTVSANFTLITSGNTCTSASKDGITWTFNARPCGTYANGDWWVVGPITITGISPLPTTGLNGTVINPKVGTSEQGFDNRFWANAYNDTWNVGKNLPLTVSTDSSVVSSISDPTNPQWGKIKMIGILTVVGSTPADGSFRPSPYSSGVGSKNSIWKESDLQYSKLNNLGQLASKPSITDLAEKFSHPWLETDIDWTGRFLHMPYMAENGYGKDIAVRTNDAGLSLNLNYSTAQKRDLLVGFVQVGLDNYGLLQQGGTWYADGGHNMGRLTPLVVAAGVLDDANLKNMIKGPTMKFQEFQSTWTIEQADLTKPQGYWQSDGLSGQMFACTNEDPCFRYTSADIGKAEWGIRHTEQPEKDNNYWKAAYRDINGGVFVGTSMVAQVMGLRSTVNWEPLFLYAKRHIDYEQSSAYQSEFAYNPTNSFQREFYNTYKNTGLTLTSYNLSVGTTGFGTISASPAGTSCGTNCYSYPLNTTTQVTLTAIPTGSATFTGWTGGTCSGTGTCTVTMNTNQSVTATFNSPVLPFSIGKTIQVTGSPQINVRSSGSSATQANVIGTQPFGATGLLVGGPIQSDGWTWWNINYDTGVDGWSSQELLEVTNVVEPVVFNLTTSATNGSITRSPNATSYANGTSVTLTATPENGYQFSSWSGCTSTTATCTVVMDANKTVTASFTLIPTGTNLLYQNAATLTLDGTTAGTEIAVDDSKITNKLTVSAWVARSSDMSAYPGIVSDEDYGANKGYYLGDASSGTNNQICFRVNGGAGDNSAMACESSAMISSIFTHYVGVFDGTTQTISLYRDGTLVSQKSHPSTSVSLDTGTEILGAGWKGQVKDVKIFHGAMTPADIGTPITTFTLTTTGTNGSITRSPNATSYTNGTTVTLTAVPNAGYQFSSWSGCTSTTSTCIVTMTGDKTVSAAFTLIPVTSTTLLYQNADTLTLDGTTAGTEIAVDDSKITNKLTVSAWVARSSDMSAYPSIVADEDYAGNKGYYLGDTKSGTNNAICFRVNGGAGNNTAACESSAVISTAFTHYVGVFDGTAQTISLYRNGILVSQKSARFTSVSLDTGNELLGAGWKGQIKDVKIFNTVLTNNIQ